MNGTPVWLCSVSHRSKTTDKFTDAERARAKALLLWMLEGRGNPKRQRFFRMCVTMCLHRAITDEEQARLPATFHEAKAIDIAGGPLEVLEETEPGLPSTRPCESPNMVPLELAFGPSVHHRGATFAADCGKCAPCVARIKA